MRFRNSLGLMIFVLFQKLRKMAFVPGHKVIRSGRIRACDKDVVGGIGCNLKQVRCNRNPTMVSNQPKELLPEPPPNLESRPRKNHAVFRQNLVGNVPPGGLSNREQEHGPLQSFHPERGRHHHVRVENQPKWHHRFLDCCAALMI